MRSRSARTVSSISIYYENQDPVLFLGAACKKSMAKQSGSILGILAVALLIAFAAIFLFWRRPLVENHTNGPWAQTCKNIVNSKGDKYVSALCKTNSNHWLLNDQFKAENCRKGMVNNNGKLQCA